MMYYRRKIVLALIETLGGQVEKIRFQKLLFLYSVRKPKPEYDFIPYKYGCYSYSAKADMNTMIKKGMISDADNQYRKEDKLSYFQTLKSSDQRILSDVIGDFGKMSSKALIKHTYLNFPFYAIRSKIAKEVLPGKLYERVDNAIPKEHQIILFTIGYEGISLEAYLQKLIRNNVKLLIDVRKNPLSMKYGFSKTLLKSYCASLDIEYQHIPEVGIESNQRQQLDTQKDYDRLFLNYKRTTLKESTKFQSMILELLKKHRRIALTCFEAEPCQCHRYHLANAISKLPEYAYKLKHL